MIFVLFSGKKMLQHLFPRVRHLVYDTRTCDPRNNGTSRLAPSRPRSLLRMSGFLIMRGGAAGSRQRPDCGGGLGRLDKNNKNITDQHNVKSRCAGSGRPEKSQRLPPHSKPAVKNRLRTREKIHANPTSSSSSSRGQEEKKRLLNSSSSSRMLRPILTAV